MKLSLKLAGSVPAVALFLFGHTVSAQRPHANALAAKSAPGSYTTAQDVSLQGTVVKFTEKSQAPPIGAHLLLQTASGNFDVHIGDARLLQNAKMNLAAGANVRIVGQMQTVGKSQIFFARLVQQGTQLVAVRSEHGLPLAPALVRGNRAANKNVDASQQGGAR